MATYNTAKSYDIKTFLGASGRNRSLFRKGFVSLTIGRKNIYTAFLAVISAIALGFAFSSVNVSHIGKKELLSAIGFVTPMYNTNHKGDMQGIFFGLASSLIGQNPTRIHEISRPPLPNARIKTMDDASIGIEIKNETSYTIDVGEYLKNPPVIATASPKVLIVHTHGSESYTPSEKFPYIQNGNYRTQDKNYNMIKVGEKIAEEIRKSGIDVIHDTSINDFPSYNASYNKTEEVIKSYLKKDKDIVFVFDIHRDAVGNSDNIVRFATNINGKTAAQIMTVCGTDTNLENENWRQNLAFGLYIQNKLEEKHPGFMRPVNLRKERFNMHLSTGSLLFEIGTNGNTLDEALTSGEILGRELGIIIAELAKK